MKRFLLLLLAICLTAQSVRSADEAPFIFYKHQGGFSPYGGLIVTVATSGKTHVTVNKRDSVIEYDAILSEDEFRALKTLIRATDFFSQPDKDPQFATDTGVTELAINLEDEKRTLKFSYRPELNPLCEIFWQLIAEAQAFDALASDGDFTLIDNLRDKVLQPYRLKTPLMKYILATKDHRKSQVALDALSFLTTPEEFVGFISLIRESDPSKKYFLAFVRGELKQHVHALLPIYLQFVKENYPRQHELSQWEKGSLDGAIGALVAARYQPVLPLLLTWFDAQTEPYVSNPLSYLTQFGAVSMRALVPKLESKEASHKLNAIELMVMSARLNPHNPYPNPISEQEYAQMKDVFTKQVMPKLWTMTKSDASTEVRDKAYKAIQEIEYEMKKGDAPVPAASVPPPKLHGPFVTISVSPDHTLNRTGLDSEAEAITWNIVRDGTMVLQRNAKNETQFKYPDEKPGLYTVYITAWADGAYHVASNIVFYRIDK